ncbi:MAG: hypothetical protein HUJ96_02855 [Marinilabiliaceae bacterium]|nr:hypothetical protein [Marinilabiliaceae bacterium]
MKLIQMTENKQSITNAEGVVTEKVYYSETAIEDFMGTSVALSVQPHHINIKIQAPNEFDIQATMSKAIEIFGSFEQALGNVMTYLNGQTATEMQAQNTEEYGEDNTTNTEGE